MDFAEGPPCLLLEASGFSSESSWEARLDGEHWVAAEVWQNWNPLVLPDAERETVVSLPVVSVLSTHNAALDEYTLKPGEPLLVDFRETELGNLIGCSIFWTVRVGMRMRGGTSFAIMYGKN
jgi:hypothetical protein